jgi:hypothetical protein
MKILYCWHAITNMVTTLGTLSTSMSEVVRRSGEAKCYLHERGQSRYRRLVHSEDTASFGVCGIGGKSYFSEVWSLQ